MSLNSSSPERATPSRRHRRQGPTRLGFEKLLALFGLGEAARSERYSRLREHLIRFFHRARCPFPEDLADEVIDRVARRLEEGVQLRAEALHFYCGGVARIVYREALRNHHAEADRLPGLARALAERAEPPCAWHELQLACLDDCLSRLPAGDRRLLLAYYQSGDAALERQKICRELSVSANSVRLRTHRLRRRIESELKELLGTGETRPGKAAPHASGGTRDSSSRQAASPSW